jgi:hypothetical protein
MRPKRYTARRAEREVYALLRDLDGRARAVARLSAEDMPADLAHFAEAVKAFRAQFGPFLERWGHNITRRTFLRWVTSARNHLHYVDMVARSRPEPLDADIVEGTAKIRDMLAAAEPLVPGVKAALADDTAPHPVSTSELERMLQEAPKRKRRR